MKSNDAVTEFYLKHLPGAKIEGGFLKAYCPFCVSRAEGKPGVLLVDLNEQSFFRGYFRCLKRCRPGGFPLHFGRIMGIDPRKTPGFDPEREPYAQEISYPAANLDKDIIYFMKLMGDDEFEHFSEFGISKSVLSEMRIGYNGRYIVYPYFQDDGHCYSYRCVSPIRDRDCFWRGNETFISEQFRVFNVSEIDRCEGGALFITEGEKELLAIRELGWPGVAVPTAADLETLSEGMLEFVNHVFLVVSNTPESRLSARNLATLIGYKTRIFKWPYLKKQGYGILHLVKERGKHFKSAVTSMIKASKPFSPFSSPEKEYSGFMDTLNRYSEGPLFRTGFGKLDQALGGIRGITILGGRPKAGKSSFFLQVSSEIARLKVPVIYYDFENGRRKIYSRILCRFSRIPEKKVLQGKILSKEEKGRLAKAEKELKEVLGFFRVVTDRKLTPGIMRKQIEFLKHETGMDEILVIIDSLHKLPFRDLSERRTGIDSWLRNFEAMRDEQNASFFVISELSRSREGGYSNRPDMGAFKGSGDIEYSADNAMILVPENDPMDPLPMDQRTFTLWMVASRENNPGKIAEYALDYPFWGFLEN